MINKTEMIPPKVHLLEEVFSLKNDDYILVVNKQGKKNKMKVVNVKDSLLSDIIKKIESIENKVKQESITKEKIIKAFSKSKYINFGKPFNLITNPTVKTHLKDGTIVSDGSKVEVKLNGVWKLLT